MDSNWFKEMFIDEAKAALDRHGSVSGESSVSTEGLVSVLEQQSFTDVEKALGRKNIGACTVEEVIDMITNAEEVAY